MQTSALASVAGDLPPVCSPPGAGRDCAAVARYRDLRKHHGNALLGAGGDRYGFALCASTKKRIAAAA